MFFLLPARKGVLSLLNGAEGALYIRHRVPEGRPLVRVTFRAESFTTGRGCRASKSLSGFDAANATAEEKENLRRLLAYFEPELRAVGLAFPASAKPVRASKPGLKTRFEMAGLVSRALESVDREKADKEDVERLQRLGTEYRNELAVWGAPVEELEDRVDVLESGMGGWHFSGSMRFDGNYYRAGAVGRGYGIYRRVGTERGFQVLPHALNMRKRVDDRTTFYGRLEKDPVQGTRRYARACVRGCGVPGTGLCLRTVADGLAGGGRTVLRR